MVLKKNAGLLHNIVLIFKGLFYSHHHLFLIYAFYSNLALAVYFYIQSQKIISYFCLFIGLMEYIICILYDERYKKLQQKHNLLANCYDSLPSLFVILDKNWNVIFANDIFQAFSIGKQLNTFDDVMACFVENEELCEVLMEGKRVVEEVNYFSGIISIDSTKDWKIYLGLMKKSGKNFYVCYISDIQKSEKDNISLIESTLDDFIEAIVIYNNKEITYTNNILKIFLKSYDISLITFYNHIVEQDGKKLFYLSYTKNDRDMAILKFDRIKQQQKENILINTYRIYMNEQIINTDIMNGIVILDEHYNIIENNNKFNILVSSYFVKKTNFLQYVEVSCQGLLKQYLKEKEKNLNKDIQSINVTLGDKTGNLVKIYGDKLQNCGWLLHIQDNNIQRDLEYQLLHSQRLGLLGQVLSAVSHDFNNILTAMSGFCDLLSTKISVVDEKYFSLVQMKHNINRAINLVKYILYLSKKKDSKINTVEETNVHEVIGQLLNNMGRLLGESITMNFVRNENNIIINIPTINLEQILLNLIVNARDAMHNNGVITITTNLIDSKMIEINNEVLEPGLYLELSVSDTGEGISEQNKKKIFDSFFTTKEEGTGIGLSTIQSIIKQYRGFIKVNSRLNVGTTFKIYLPASEGKSRNFMESPNLHITSNKKVTVKEMNIILLEDDLSLNQLFESSLKQKSYVKIFSFRSIKEAMNMVNKMSNNGEEIHVLIADVIIKDGNSLDLVEKVMLLYSNIKYVLISGHDREYLEKLNKYNLLQKKKNDIIFLQKPFSLEIINKVIEDIYEQIEK